VHSPIGETVPAKVCRSALTAGLALKRMLDVSVASAVLMALAPVLAIIAALIKFDSSGPVFYAALRAGRKASPSLLQIPHHGARRGRLEKWPADLQSAQRAILQNRKRSSNHARGTISTPL